MSQDGLAIYYWDRVWDIWNKRNDPKVFAQILEYLTKIEIHSSDPDIKLELERTKYLLEKEASQHRNNSSCPRSTHDMESRGHSGYVTAASHHSENRSRMNVQEDLPIQVEDLVMVEKPNVSFDRIGGLLDVKELLKMEIIYPRLHPEKYRMYGRTPGNGILLWGAPGCGKTQLAKAIAKESGETVFISPKVSDIMNRWVGQSEKVIASIFEYARKFPRATLFFDEIDYVAPRAGPSYMMRIKRELLQQMDGISTKKDGLLVFGATNRPWILDPAARRPSPEGLRFSKIILVPPPDFEARREIFKIMLAKINNELIADDVDLNELADLTHGFSGADIGTICEEAVDIPLNQHIKGTPPRPVSMNDFLQVISTQSKSIAPWIFDAAKSVKRYGESYLASQLKELVEEFMSTKDVGGNAKRENT